MGKPPSAEDDRVRLEAEGVQFFRDTIDYLVEVFHFERLEVSDNMTNFIRDFNEPTTWMELR